MGLHAITTLSRSGTLQSRDESRPCNASVPLESFPSMLLAAEHTRWWSSTIELRRSDGTVAAEMVRRPFTLAAEEFSLVLGKSEGTCRFAAKPSLLTPGWSARDDSGVAADLETELFERGEFRLSILISDGGRAVAEANRIAEELTLFSADGTRLLSACPCASTGRWRLDLHRVTDPPRTRILLGGVLLAWRLMRHTQSAAVWSAAL